MRLFVEVEFYRGFVGHKSLYNVDVGIVNREFVAGAPRGEAALDLRRESGDGVSLRAVEIASGESHERNRLGYGGDPRFLAVGRLGGDAAQRVNDGRALVGSLDVELERDASMLGVKPFVRAGSGVALESV